MLLDIASIKLQKLSLCAHHMLFLCKMFIFSRLVFR